MARSLGAKIVIVHGETIVEPVAPGTNFAGIEAGADIIAHPGLISEEDVKFASEKGVLLEITARGGHSLTNGHVAKLASKFNARMVIDTDSHAPGDLINSNTAMKVVCGAGLGREDFTRMQQNAIELIQH
jgi:histidinol phosphatase-like PHP family hydrolase